MMQHVGLVWQQAPPLNHQATLEPPAPKPNPQEVRVQERLQCLDAGSVPSAISVMLLDEMADTCQAGGVCVWGGGAQRRAGPDG